LAQVGLVRGEARVIEAAKVDSFARTMSLEDMDIAPERKKYIIDRLNAPLEAAVGALIAAEAVDPAVFLLKEFSKNVKGAEKELPDEASEVTKNRELKEQLAKLQSDFNKMVAVNVQLRNSVSAAAAGDNAEEEEEEEDDDDVEEPPQMSAQRTGNRTSVSAEAYGAWNTKKAFDPPVIKKSAEESERLKKILNSSFLFNTLDDKNLQVVILAMAKVEYKADTKIITEGDDGDFLFVVEEGSLACFKEADPDKILKEYTTAGVFGELALLYNAPRAASVKAKADVVLWKLDRETFSYITSSSHGKKRDEQVGFLQKVSLLKDFTEATLAQLSDALVRLPCGADEEVVKQGDPGDIFYIVEEGTLVAIKDGKEVLKYSPGDYFGELALLNKSEGERAATVKTTSKVTLLSLQRKSFQRMLGSLEELLFSRASAYA